MRITDAITILDALPSKVGAGLTPDARRQVFEDTCIAGRITMLDTVAGKPAIIVHAGSHHVRVVLGRRDIRQLINLYFASDGRGGDR